MSTPVCILTAGAGTRMGSKLAWLNKALLPLDDEAVLTKIVRALGPSRRYVIGLGHNAEQVRGYVEAAHPDLDVEFVEVSPVTGPGSGPGRSLLCCREALGGPFVFVPCDAVIDEPLEGLDEPGDWVGVARVPAEDTAQYCNFEVDQAGTVVGIRDKERAGGDAFRAFTGVMRIENTEAFWSALQRSEQVAGEIQVSGGLAALAELGTLGTREHPWIDIGEERSYRSEIDARHGFDFSKPGEALYIVGGRVLKLFENHGLAAKRVQRMLEGASVFPPAIDAAPGFVGYEYAEGQTLYSCVDRPMLERLLSWCETDVWRDRAIDATEFAEACDLFYQSKTLARVEQFAKLVGLENEPGRVEGKPVPGIGRLLELVDWEQLARGGKPVFFHGDLQFDNVLIRPGGGFTLLDWRQDFGGRTDAGDLDYDLAKMLGGIRVDYAKVKRGDIAYRVENGSAVIGLPEGPAGLESVVLDHARSMGRSVERIELITGLIHLNMSPLHGEPFGSALRDLARLELAASLGVVQGAERAA